MIELLLPRTDAGVAVQALVAALVFGAAGFAVRHDRDLRVLVAGLAVITAAWFGIRSVH